MAVGWTDREPRVPTEGEGFGSKFLLLKLIALLFADQVQLGGLFWSPDVEVEG